VSLGFARTITPTFGAELLPDPGLEGTYTSGLVTTNGMVKSGSPVVAQSSDVHGGAKAQEFTPVANSNLIWLSPIPASVTGFKRFTEWYKRTAGASGKIEVQSFGIGGSGCTYRPKLTSATWAQIEIISRDNSASSFQGVAINRDASVFDTVIVDDLSLTKLTLSTALATRKTIAAAGAIVKASVTLSASYQGGVITNADSLSNPKYFVLGYVDANPTTSTVGAVFCTLDQVVNDVWTRLIHAVVTYVAGAPVEVRNSGNTYQLFYNGAQVGTDQTITDATLRAGTLAAQFATSPQVVFADFVA
jgi:hypothetical protein